MENIIKQLLKISKDYPLEDKYNWDVPSSCPIEIPQKIENNFSKNIYLKENMSEQLESDKEMKSHYWIIREWGGIKSFKQNDRNDEKIKKFKKQLKTGRLTKETFGLISSLSKIASFMKPNEFVIYDSRVIYSLNWLIFCYSKDKHFFPQPSGRSSALAKYDMQTIFRLSKNKYEYKSHKTAYSEYCQLLSGLSKAVYGDDEMPYKAEMLLFLIAPEYIVKNIEALVSISVKQLVKTA